MMNEIYPDQYTETEDLIFEAKLVELEDAVNEGCVEFDVVDDYLTING